MKKNWTGTRKSVFTTLGASDHTKEERQREDFYATSPIAAKLLLEIERFEGSIWEPSCGEGHLSKVFEKHGYYVISTDLIYRGYGQGDRDFLAIDNQEWRGNIITNPPYRYAQEFVEKALQIIPTGKKVAMFLKVQFLEGKKRKELFRQHPPKTVHISSSRILCAKNGEFQKMKDGGGSAVAYCWIVWEKGFQGPTTLKWFN